MEPCTCRKCCPNRVLRFGLMGAAHAYRECKICDGGKTSLCTGCERTADAMLHARAVERVEQQWRIDAAVAKDYGMTRAHIVSYLRDHVAPSLAERVLLEILDPELKG